MCLEFMRQLGFRQVSLDVNALIGILGMVFAQSPEVDTLRAPQLDIEMSISNRRNGKGALDSKSGERDRRYSHLETPQQARYRMR